MTNYEVLIILGNTIDLYNDFEEILRERIFYYKKLSIPLDFWIFKNSKIDNSLFDKLKKPFNKYILLTTNKVFFNWIKLRYGYFENLEALSIKKHQYTINGYFTKLNNQNIKNLSLKSIFFSKY